MVEYPIPSPLKEEFLTSLKLYISKALAFNFVQDEKEFMEKVEYSRSNRKNITPNGAVADERMIKVHNRLRLNRDAIGKTISYHKDYHFKPVWDGTEENLEEIETFRVEMDIPKDKTFIMPAGDTRETLVEMYPKVFELCAEKGYNMTGRDHIIAFDTERGV